MYHTIAMDSQPAPAQGQSFVGALAGAAIGAVVGAVVLGAVVAVDHNTNLFTTTTVRPAVTTMGTVPVPVQTQAGRAVAGAQYAAPQTATAQQAAQAPVNAQSPQTSVYSWAFVMFAAVAGAVNGMFLWNSKKVAMAATTGRREAMIAGVATAGMVAAGPASAAYGDSANVFGSAKPIDQSLEIAGAGWKGQLPAKFKVSKETSEFPGTVLRYEDNFDAVTYAVVTVNSVGKNSVTEMGSIDDVRNSVVKPMLGTQSWEGSSISEGGFGDGKVSSAALLDQGQVTKDGKTYYQYELLTRTADGNEGGRHQLFSVACAGGSVYVFKCQVGDKRWFKGLERPIKQSIADFTVL